MIWILNRISLSIFLIFSLTNSSPAFCDQEKISNYQSQITVNSDSSLDVTETIEVVSNQDIIRRGIYRDFPTRYFGKYGSIVSIGFKVKEVLRDGKPESYSLHDIQNGKRIYIGNPDIILAPGKYTYVISYTTTRQLGFFDNYDELYWNVTGNGWVFPIQKVVASVHLPNQAPIIQKTAYTGILDAKGQDFEITALHPGEIIFQTTQPLGPYEGFTIAVAWPKGYVQPPSKVQKLLYVLQDNFNLIAAVLITLIILIYYLVIWLIVNRSPQKGTIIPLFTPPKDLSPAAALHILKMGFNLSNLKKAFTASIVNMAVKGQVLIQKENKKSFILKKQNDSMDSLSVEEQSLSKNLFNKKTDCVLSSDNASLIRQAVKLYHRVIENRYTEPYFKNQQAYAVWGHILSFLGFFGVVFFLHPWFSIPIFILNRIFSSFKVPTQLGRRVMDEIEGFILFLSVTETDRYKVLNSPEVTPEIYEKYLPYAIAFNVEKEWSKKLTMPEAVHPVWYQDTQGRALPYLAFSNLGTELSQNLSSFVTPAATVSPGTFSGSGGGGGAGRGGGGGGGGGW